MGVASRKPRAGPAFEATKRAASDLYRRTHVEYLEKAALALAVQWYVQSGTRPPGWLNPPGLDRALEEAEVAASAPPPPPDAA